MNVSLSFFILMIFASGMVALLVCVGALRRRPDPMAIPLALLMFATAAWAIPHGISLASTGVDQVVFWNKARYPGTVIAPVAYLVVALKYAGYDRWLSVKVYAILGIVPTLTLLIVWTNSYHGLFWEVVSVETVHGMSVFAPTFGPWYWINIGYLYLATVIGLVLFGDVMVRSGTVYRKQAALVFIGAIVPLVTNVVVMFGIGPDPVVDFTTIALAVSGITIALALFVFDLIDIRPIGRNHVIEKLDDGIVIVGPEGRIRDFNPTAASILGDIGIGHPADAVLPSFVVPDGGNLVIDTDDGTRHYRTRSTELTDSRDREIGRIVYLNDVTELIEREQRISVLNRVLRHNIRNDLNIVDGRLEILDDLSLKDTEPHLDIAREHVTRMLDFSEKARYVEETLTRSESSVTVSAAVVAERVVRDAKPAFPDATIEYAGPDPHESVATVTVVDETLFEMALAELVENGVEHNDQDTPQVTVRVDHLATGGEIAIEDDGPGIAPDETDVITGRSESALEHTSGLGLWLVQWTVSLSGGELSFINTEPRGTTVTITVPSPSQ